MHPGAVVAIVVGGLVVTFIVVGILAAIAIPVYLDQREKAEDAGAGSDARVIANEIYYYALDDSEDPAMVTYDGVDYVIAGPDGEFSRVSATPGVALDEYVAEAGTFCVSTIAQRGTADGAHYSDASGEVTDGPCP